MNDLLERERYDKIHARQWQTAIIFLLPYMISFILFRLGPGIAGIFTSFTSWKIIGTPEWIGLDNYKALAQDEMFFTSFKNTLFFLCISAPAMIVLGLGLAILLNQPLRGKVLARTLIFAPYVVMSAVVGIIWNWVYDKNLGLLNYYLSYLGIHKIGWLISSDFAMIAIAVTTIWWLIGYNMILFLAGLQDIPEELYEAALVDGASAWKRFTSVTLPLLKPTTYVVIMMTVIQCMQVFDQVYVMTNGGPGTSTLTLVQYLYFQAFQNYNLGYGSAIGVILFLSLVVFSIIQGRAMRAEKGV